MAINLDCPRCKVRLRVPDKKAGGYVNCPHCQGRFWVDKAMAHDASPADTVTMAVPPPAPPPYVANDSPPSAGLPRESVSPESLPATKPPSTAMVLPPMRTPAPVAPPAVPQTPRKVARFISAETAQSTLQPAADGKLPELHLVDIGQKEDEEKKPSSMSPLSLFGIIAGSLVLTLVILLLGDTSNTGNTEAKAKAWSQIEANYFTDPGSNELQPYNQLLREAKRAHLSQDRKTEREMFDKVLVLLRAERSQTQKGLTGSRERDKKLEEQVILLRNGLMAE
jgi:hypothetical protein